MNNTKNENSTNLNGWWYFPIMSKKHNEVKGDDNSLDIKSELEKIEGYEVLPINIMNEKGEVDDYLSNLVSELFHVASFSRIYNDKEFLGNRAVLDKKMKELEYVNGIHEDIVFLKQVYFQEMNKLNRLEKFVNSQSDLSHKVEYLLSIFKKYKERLERYNKNSDILSDKMQSRLIALHKFRSEFSYIGLHVLKNREDSRGLKEEKELVIKQIKRAKSIWNGVYLLIFNIINWEYLFDFIHDSIPDSVLIDEMKVIDKEFGKIQIQCCTCLALSDATKYDNLMTHGDRIRSFKKLISSDSSLRKEYTGKKAKRCYSQMWIDDCSTQYFALSCGPDYGNAELYYETAKELLSQCINYNSHCKYEPVPFTKEMRYYHSDRQGDYVEYNDVEKMLSIEELRQGFSCCERKLLTKVEEIRGGDGLVNGNMHICIKYNPCKICDRALNAYEKKGINFEMIELEKYKGRNSKYLELDKKIKMCVECMQAL